jgi:tRNA(adenine34) deaminase
MDYEPYMKIALAEAEKALATGEFPVGCALVSAETVVATGHRIGTGQNELDHAEIRALRCLAEGGPGAAEPPLTAFCTMEPCLMCLGALLLGNVTQVVYAYEDVMGGGTGCRLEDVGPLYRQRRLKIVPHVMRRESLALFKRFFARPENRYWRRSLLAEYTLEA